jgi:oxygen-dependent protoporphyrinogen oxidase
LIGIIGGGISGLVLGNELLDLGTDFVLLEASWRTGGVLWSQECDGLNVELGPQRSRLTPVFRELVENVGLSRELVTAPTGLPLFIYSRGKLRIAPLSLNQAITTDLIPLSSKTNIMLDFLRSGPKTDETAGAFLRRKFGVTAYRNLFGPIYGGIYGSDPDRMFARHGLTQTLENMGLGRSILWGILRVYRHTDEALICSFRDGLGALPKALQVRLGDRVQLECPVRTIRKTCDGWEIIIDALPPLSVSQLVLTCPADQTAKIVQGVAPEAAVKLSLLRYNPLAVVHMRSEADLYGLGYQVAFGEPFETRGVTWNHSLFRNSGLYTAYLGGMNNPDIVDQPDDEIGSIACQEFKTITGHDSEMLMVSRTWMPSWDESWDGISGLNLPDGLHICSNYLARPGIVSRIVEAQELAHNLANSLMTKVC